MTLARASVIDAIAARLNAPTDRIHPLDESEIAGAPWRVYSDIPESVSAASLDGAIDDHRLPLVAEGFVRAVDDVDNAAQALASAGMAALFAPPLLYQLQHETTEIEADPEHEAAAAVIRLRLSARYFVNPAQPDILLSN